MTEKAKAAKDLLGRAYWSNVHINAKLRQVQYLRSTAARITQQFGGLAVSHSRDPHSMESTVVKIIDLEAAMNAEIDEMVAERLEIKEIIDAVSGKTERAILELRYEALCGWSEIETMLSMSRSRIFALHAHALEAAYSIMEQKGMVEHIG